jgi:hypothetical protein
MIFSWLGVGCAEETRPIGKIGFDRRAAGCPGEGKRVKEQLLSEGDRAALQALVPLAGALGVGTTFALFFGGRRRSSGSAVFELFAIVAVLTAAGSTAFFAISLLHQNEPITSHDLTQTATPLIVAAFLLVFVSVFARLPGSGLRLFALVPLGLSGVVIAALLASTSWSAEPENASVAALIILGVGAALWALTLAFERFDVGLDRRWEHKRLTRLYAAGYLPDEKQVHVVLPRRDGDLRSANVACWTRRGKSYMDIPSWLHLRREATARWRAFATGEAQPPVGPEILVRVKVGYRIPLIRDRAVIRVATLEPAAGGEAREQQVRSNEDGLFDVTGLGVV